MTTGGIAYLDNPELLKKILSNLEKIGNGLPLQKALIKKGAYLLKNIAHEQPFHDGNKRTAITLTYNFLEDNKIHFKYGEDDMYSFMKKVKNSTIHLKDVETWIKIHVD